MELAVEGHRFEDLSERPGEADAEILRDAGAPDLSFKDDIVYDIIYIYILYYYII